MNYRHIIEKASDFLLIFIIGWYVGTQVTFDSNRRWFVTQEGLRRNEHYIGFAEGLVTLSPYLPKAGQKVIENWLDDQLAKFDNQKPATRASLNTGAFRKGQGQ
jgi:hypothetical protein